MKPQNPKPAKNKTSTSKLWSKKQTTASKLWSKIKSFFSYDIEKDLAEEECTKSFEKIKLFTLTRTNLFVTLLLFLLVVDILVGLDIKIIYLRQILGFLFLVFVPGIVIMLILKIREVGFWEYLVYTVGLSISFIMFAGLAVNWILPWLKITDRPLSLWPILISFNIILLVMGYFAYKKNADLKPLDITHPKLDTINKIFFIAPMIFPPLSILGAFLLNNHGTNLLTMIMLGSIAVYVLLVTIFRKKLNENVWPWSLYWMMLGLVLMGSMRSWYISAPDASLEINFAKETYLNSIWGLGKINGYNAMLSVTIFPSILNLISNINFDIILKFLFPLIFSAISIIIILFFKINWNSTISFFASLFFIFQPTITGWQLLPPRQEIAFLFLGLIVLALFSKKNNLRGKLLELLFGTSMIVSHYSTAYIFLASISIIYIFCFFIKEANFKIQNKLTLTLVLLLLIFGFFWYNQITSTADGLIQFTENSLSNFNKILSDEVYSQGNSPLEYLNLIKNSDEVNPLKDLYNYSSSFVKDDLSKELLTKYPLSIKQTSQLPYSYVKLIPLSIKIEQILLLLGSGLQFIGLTYLFQNKINKFYRIFMLVFLLLFIIISILPFASIHYNLNRLHQQILIPLSVFCPIGFTIVLKKLRIGNEQIKL